MKINWKVLFFEVIDWFLTPEQENFSFILRWNYFRTSSLWRIKWWLRLFLEKIVQQCCEVLRSKSWMQNFKFKTLRYVNCERVLQLLSPIETIVNSAYFPSKETRFLSVIKFRVTSCHCFLFWGHLNASLSQLRTLESRFSEVHLWMVWTAVKSLIWNSYENLVLTFL